MCPNAEIAQNSPLAWTLNYVKMPMAARLLSIEQVISSRRTTFGPLGYQPEGPSRRPLGHLIGHLIEAKSVDFGRHRQTALSCYLSTN